MINHNYLTLVDCDLLWNHTNSMFIWNVGTVQSYFLLIKSYYNDPRRYKSYRNASVYTFLVYIYYLLYFLPMLLTDLYHYYTAPSTAHYVILFIKIIHPRRYKAMLYRWWWCSMNRSRVPTAVIALILIFPPIQIKETLCFCM